MKHTLPLLIISTFALVACGGEVGDNQSAANNQLEAADNAMWNDLANYPSDNEAVVAPPPTAEVKTETDTETRPSSRQTGAAPADRPRPAPAVREPTKAPKATPAPEPTSPPQETCAPEHRAAGHC